MNLYEEIYKVGSQFPRVDVSVILDSGCFKMSNLSAPWVFKHYLQSYFKQPVISQSAAGAGSMFLCVN